MADPKHMSVYRHLSLAKSNSHYNVSRLAAHSWQRHQTVEARRHLTPEPLNKLTRHRHDVRRLGVGIRYALHTLIHLCLIGGSQRLGIRKTPKQLWRYLVHTFVGTLSAEHHRHKQLKHASKLQLGAHVSRVLTKIVEHILISFFSFHKQYF